MARRILNRKDLRADYDAAERRQTEGGEGEEAEELEEEEGGDDAAAEGDEDAPKKKKAKTAVKAKAKPRTRTPKITRMRVVWVVLDNSNKKVGTFDYPKRKEAEELAAKLTVDKKQTHFVQPLKEQIVEEKV
jgi:hypothetical protein